MKSNTSFWAGFYGGPYAIATKEIDKQKYMDWHKACDIIEKAIEENSKCVIYAGLREDWDNTCALLYDGTGEYKPNFHGFFSSCWATPIIDIDDKEIECWTYEESRSWESKVTNAPEYVRDII